MGIRELAVDMVVTLRGACQGRGGRCGWRQASLCAERVRAQLQNRRGEAASLFRQGRQAVAS